MEKKGRILSGMRPSGKLHIGHFIGTLNNWVKLQDEYSCYYMVADLHALTTEYANTGNLKDNTQEMVLDWLACGLDPQKSVIFRQSDIKEHSELHMVLSMITPLGWLFRCPTYKEQLKEIKDKDIHTYGFLGYPVLQAADILMYKATHVPVGEDQLPHLELTREIARRFNFLYGEIFPEPKAILSNAPRVPGTDGRKMSKSYNNAICLADTPAEITQKVNQMFTDPQKIRLTDLGHPEGCIVYAFHKFFSENAQETEALCKEGKIGCVADKKELTKNILKILEPVREKREQFAKQKGLVDDILAQGRKQAFDYASQVMAEVLKTIKL
ncbi:MAG: tryptophan--tRNA ligase [Elusimicrobia bacterium RIFOXYA2_FULL_39_19]|nr:MAG: tryptophan--tRNA ligase [Elusimicrobia bacterium RIFOXYA2_FULL_39_19]